MPTETYYFDSFSDAEHWEVDWANISDGDENTYGKTRKDYNPVHLLNGNTCPGTDLGTISKVEVRAKGYYTFLFPQTIRIDIRPVFAGGDGDNHTFTLPKDTGDWSEWFDITSDTNAPPTWSWDNVSGLDCDLEALDIMAPYCSKVEIRVTVTAPPLRVPKPTAAVGNPYMF